MSYCEDDYLMLSGIQHFAFCRRQWALIHIEQQWCDNLRTVEGEIMHEKAHDPTAAEKRGDLIVARAVPIHSRELGISGECDVVEFRKNSKGISLSGREGLYSVTPIEYKRGEPKANNSDVLQLAAQVICLEEMLCCDIEKGYLFYGETRRRTEVCFTDEIRKEVYRMISEMHEHYSRGYTPKAKRTKGCNACSLKDICLPVLEKKQSASKYITARLLEGEE